MGRYFISFIFALTLCHVALGQNPVGIGTQTPNPNAILDITSSSKGILLPRMTTVQRNAIPTTATENGLLVYDTDDHLFYYWLDTSWVAIPNILADTDDQTISVSNDTLFIEDGNFVVVPGDGDWARNGDDLYNLNTGNVGVGTMIPNAKLEVHGSGTSIATASMDVRDASGNALFIATDDQKVMLGSGTAMTLPEKELDVHGHQIVGRITPRYLGPDTFSIPGTNILATYHSEVVWERNSHLYVRFTISDTISWLQAQEGARFLAGYLPTVTSAAENDFIKNNILGPGNTAIGLTDVLEEGEWRWVTGEIGAFGQNEIFADWHPDEPNDASGCNGGEDAAAYWNTAWDPQQRWNDINVKSTGPICGASKINELLVEFEYVESP